MWDGGPGFILSFQSAPTLLASGIQISTLVGHCPPSGNREGQAGLPHKFESMMVRRAFLCVYKAPTRFAVWIDTNVCPTSLCPSFEIIHIEYPTPNIQQ